MMEMPGYEFSERPLYVNERVPVLHFRHWRHLVFEAEQSICQCVNMELISLV